MSRAWKTRQQFADEDDDYGYPKSWGSGGGPDGIRAYLDGCMADQRMSVLEGETEQLRILLGTAAPPSDLEAYDTWLTECDGDAETDGESI